MFFATVPAYAFVHPLDTDVRPYDVLRDHVMVYSHLDDARHLLKDTEPPFYSTTSTRLYINKVDN